MGADIETRSPSSLSSDYVDDDATEAESSISAAASSEGPVTSKEADGVHSTSARRMRGISHVDESPSVDSYGETSGPGGDCSHFYLYKEGTTVCCARCGHLRNSGNPEWLSRVKRRGNKIPADIPMATLPSVGSAPDLQAPFGSLGVQLNSGGRGSPNHMVGSMAERGAQRQGRSTVPFASHLMSSQGYGLGSMSNVPNGARGSPGMNARGSMHPETQNLMVQQIMHQQHQQFQQHHYHAQQHQQGPQLLHALTTANASPSPHHLGMNSSQGAIVHTAKSGHARGRARPQPSMLATADQQGTAVSGLYGNEMSRGRGLLNAGVNPSGSLGLATSFRAPSNMQQLSTVMSPAPHARLHGFNVDVSNGLRNVDPKTGLAVQPDGSGPRVDEVNFTHSSGGSSHASTPMRNGVARGGGEESGGLSAVDLGTDFMNEDFGFDIGQIVDDNPPAVPTKAATSYGATEAGAEMGKIYEVTRAQQNGMFRR